MTPAGGVEGAARLKELEVEKSEIERMRGLDRIVGVLAIVGLGTCAAAVFTSHLNGDIFLSSLTAVFGYFAGSRSKR